MKSEYIKNKPYCIEERAKKYYGLTECFEFAGYLLEDGTMLNFSYGSYQRDEDHRSIGWFFKNAKSTAAMLKFMRRGNIRVMCNTNNYCFEYIRKPTKEQIGRIREAYKISENMPNFEFYLEKSDNHGRTLWSSRDIYQMLEETGCY